MARYASLSCYYIGSSTRTIRRLPDEAVHVVSGLRRFTVGIFSIRCFTGSVT
jgi:hypothetical protein